MAWYHDYLDAWNANDEKRVLSFFAEDCRYYDHTIGEEYFGHPGIALFLKRAFLLSSDHRITPLNFFQSGQNWASESEFGGTHDGSLNGLPVSGRPFKFRVASVGALNSEGKVLFNRDYWNMVEFLVCVGMMPPPPAPSG